MLARRLPGRLTLAWLMWAILLVGSSPGTMAQLFDTERDVSKIPSMVLPGAIVSPEFDKVVLEMRLGHILKAQAYRGNQRVTGVRNVGDEVKMDVKLTCTDYGGTTSTEYSKIAHYMIAMGLEDEMPEYAGYNVLTGESGELFDVAYAVATADSSSENPHTTSVTVFTAHGAASLCGSASAGTERLTMRVDLGCARAPGSRAGDGAGAIINKMLHFDLVVACDPNYRVPVTTPVRWSHRCPTNWVVRGTDQQVAESDLRKSSCVKQGAASVGTKACPFYYVFDAALQTYVKQGEIIQNLVGRASEALQGETIPAHLVSDGKLRISIREEKDEVSFVNYLALQVGDRVIAAEPTTAETALLAEQDEHYFRMSTGDELTLVFDIGVVSPTEPIRLLSAGYYEPYSP